VPAPAPTIPLKTAAGTTTKPGAPAPAPTIPLATNTKPLTGGSAAATKPLPPTQPTQPLPAATVQLQQTQQLGASTGQVTQSPTIQTAPDEDIADENRGGGLALALIVFVAALFAFVFQAMSVNAVTDGWSKLFEAS